MGWSFDRFELNWRKGGQRGLLLMNVISQPADFALNPREDHEFLDCYAVSRPLARPLAHEVTEEGRWHHL